MAFRLARAALDSALRRKPSNSSRLELTELFILGLVLPPTVSPPAMGSSRGLSEKNSPPELVAVRLGSQAPLAARIRASAVRTWVSAWTTLG